MTAQATASNPLHTPDHARESAFSRGAHFNPATELPSPPIGFLPLSLYENGFTDLIPVAPPGVTISPRSKLLPTQLGKVPGRRNKDGMWAGYAGWLKSQHTVDDVREWMTWGANVGLKADHFPGLDIDSEDNVISQWIEELAIKHFGEAPCRFGRRPKRLLMYTTMAPFGRLRVWGTKGTPGTASFEKHLVEVLGTGQQYLVYGVHPTGANYEWTEDMRAYIPDLLTPITRAQAEAFREQVAEFFRTLDLEVSFEGDGTPSAKVAADQQALRAPSFEAVFEAMAVIPNDGDFDERGKWLNVAYALRASLGEEGENEARELFLAWSLKWPGDTAHPGGNDPAVVLEEFRRCVPPYKIGWPWLAELARGYGYSNAADDFQPLDPSEAQAAQIPAFVDRLNKEYALVRDLSGAVLCTPPDDRVSLMDIAHWRNHVSLKPATSNAWLRHPHRLEYRRLVMNPALPPRSAVPTGTRLDDFNMWEGLAMEPSTSGSCDLFLAHLSDIVCDGDPRLYDWVITWLADLFQNPGSPVGTALVLRGAQGVGKDTVGEVLGRILGDRHYTVVSSPEEITGTFNAHLEGRILLHAEEAFFAGDKRTIGKLKSLITSPRLRINQKNLPTYEVTNLLHFLITSNEGWVVPAELGERRFAVLDVSRARAKDRGYFAALRQQMFSEGGCRRLLHHLLNEVRVDRDLIAQPPATKALLNQQERGLNPMQRWALECARTGRLPGGGPAPETEAVFQAIHLSSRDRRELDRATRSLIGEYLAQCGVVKRRDGNGRRSYRYWFPPLKEFRAALARDLSMAPEWDDVEEWEPGSTLEPEVLA